MKKGETKTFPQFQKSKGCLICTAALELSTNQVSHFYSLKKNTKEMIRLLETLLEKYPNEDRIFFSWDAASWHASKELNKKIEEVNSPDYRAIHKTPIVELAPLPSSAQFLNVIESIFSGLAKAIIHNSDYQSVDECKNAIDKYFDDRNNFYKIHWRVEIGDNLCPTRHTFYGRIKTTHQHKNHHKEKSEKCGLLLRISEGAKE